MLKKILFIILTCIILQSCNYKKDSIFDEEDSSKTAVMLEETKIIGENKKYLKNAVLKSEGTPRQFEIEYPFYENYSNEAMSEINKVIYESSFPDDLNEFIIFKDIFENIVVTYDIQYIDDTLLSILYTTKIESEGKFDELKKGVTINLENSNLLALSDFLTYPELIEIIESLTESDNSIITPAFESNKEHKKNIKFFLLDFFNSEDKVETYSNFYIKENKIALIGGYFPSTKEKVVVEYKLNEMLE